MNKKETIKLSEKKFKNLPYKKIGKLSKFIFNNEIYNNIFISYICIDTLRFKYINKLRKYLLKNRLKIKIIGRIMLKRLMSKSIFFTIKDGSGYIQIYCNFIRIKKDFYSKFKQLDLGDLIRINGKIFKTNMGELSIYANNLFLLSKSLRMFPDKFHGINNLEMCYRYRYLDLIVSKYTRYRFEHRSKIITFIRKYMLDNNFIEVETPVFHNMTGGASAKPFSTYYNYLNMKTFLRISPELYLKRLIIGGFDRIFEIGKNFRNEGISNKHNPEFTMIELYSTYTNYKWMMCFIECMIHAIIIFINKSKILYYKDQKIDCSIPFKKLKMNEAFNIYQPSYNINQLNNFNFIKNELKNLDFNTDNYSFSMSNMELLKFYLFEKNVVPKIIQPTYIIDYPKIISPLSHKSKKYDNLTERFELFINGFEIANGFSELNDPEDQYTRFKNQFFLKNSKNKSLRYDKEYIKSLDYAMPPTSGCGIGIDRLIMLLTNCKNIRDIVFFPYMKIK